MFVIIGILVVFGAVTGGYLMEHGNLRVLLQPAELVIIGGASIGTVLVANPLHILKKIAGGLGSAFGGSKYTRQRYLDALKTMYDLFNKARRRRLDCAGERCRGTGEESDFLEESGLPEGPPCTRLRLRYDADGGNGRN